METVETDGADFDAQARAILDASWGWRGEPPVRRTRLAPLLEGVAQHAAPFGGGTLAAWRVGEGPAVLLVHGFADSQALWAPLMADLAARGRAFVAVDMPGAGRSTAENLAPERDIDALFAVADALGPIDAAAGHSMGACSVVAALAEGLPARRAVTFALATRFQRQFARLETRFGLDAPLALIERARQILIETTPPAPRFDLAAAASRLTIPVLMIHSRDDERWTPESTDYVARKWAGARTHYVDGFGHRDIARAPALVALAADFLCADLEPAAARLNRKRPTE